VLELSQELIDEYAWSLLVDEVASAIASQDEAARLPEIVEEVRSAGLSVGLGLVSMALEAGAEPEDGAPPIFVQEGRRRWDLAWRAGGGSLDRSLRAYLNSRGRPVPVDDAAHQVALALQQGPKETRDTVIKLLETRDTYFVRDGKVGLSSWVLDISSNDEEDIIWDNFFDNPEDAEAVLGNLDAFQGDTAPQAALSAVSAFGPNVTVKLLQLARWKQSGGDYDPIADFIALVDSDDVYVAPDHTLFPAEAKQAFVDAVAAAAEGIDDEGLEEEGDPEAILDEISIGTEEIQLAIGYVMRAGASVPVETLTEELLEVQPEEPGFDLVARQFDEALRQQGEIAMCGRGRWISPQNRPEGRFAEVPEPLMVTVVRVLTPQGEPVDAEMEDAGLEGNLVAQVRDPAREDVCGEDEVSIDPRNAPRPEFVRWALPYHHTEAGTLKVRRIDSDFYGGTTGMAECIFHYEQGGHYPVWANFNLGIVFGLGEFYQKYCPPSGAVLFVQPTTVSGEFLLRFDGESDEDMYLSDERLAELLALRQEALAKEMSLYSILCQILESHPAGASFERINTEVNVVRRTRRRLIGSVLSLYHCFTTRGKDKNVWHLDAKKIEQGRRKAKKKFLHAE
jgi:hypothetical protein